MPETVDEFQERTGINARFRRLHALGWSGCMHDSDCACSSETIENDNRILDMESRGQQ